MKFSELALPGAYLVELEPKADDRGFFARTFCRREFVEHGLVDDFVQHSISFNRERGTLRGMHFQAPPHAETKLVRCTRGRLFDVIIDIRPESPTYGRWVSMELAADNDRLLYIPDGFAHGFQTLTDGVEISYQISTFYEPGHGRGYRHDDPAFGISWPLPVSHISDQDRRWPAFAAAPHPVR